MNLDDEYIRHRQFNPYEFHAESKRDNFQSKKMKTTLNLPLDLMDKAMRAGKCGTKTETVVLALEQLIRHERLARLRALRGTMPDFDPDLDALRGRACKA